MDSTDSINSVLRKAMNRTNINWVGKFYWSSYPRPTLYQKTSKILCLNKLDSKKLYIIQILGNFMKPFSEAF